MPGLRDPVRSPCVPARPAWAHAMGPPAGLRRPARRAASGSSAAGPWRPASAPGPLWRWEVPAPCRPPSTRSLCGAARYPRSRRSAVCAAAPPELRSRRPISGLLSRAHGAGREQTSGRGTRTDAIARTPSAEITEAELTAQDGIRSSQSGCSRQARRPQGQLQLWCAR